MNQFKVRKGKKSRQTLPHRDKRKLMKLGKRKHKKNWASHKEGL